MNKKLKTLFLLFAWLILLPTVSFAAIFDPTATPIPQSVDFSIGFLLSNIFTFIWPIFVTIIVVLFIMAGLKFLTAQGNPAKIDEARHAVVWGIAGVVVIILAFSIIEIVDWAIAGFEIVP